VFADLHLHSCFSDGTDTPEEAATLGRRHGFLALALTDHDTVEGCARLAAACAQNGMESASGTELTAEHKGHELHLLGYFLDPSHPRLLHELARFQAVRQDRVREIVARLNYLHVPLQSETVFSLARCRSPGRPHVARALVQAGFCRSLDEAFERFLKRQRPAWVPKCKVSAVEAIALLHEAGGVAVLAHPVLTRADHLVGELAAAGLDGLECFHAKQSSAVADHYRRLARQYGLLETGGSDCHGSSRGRPLLGSVRVPYECFARLAAWAQARRAETPSDTENAPCRVAGAALGDRSMATS